MNVYTCWHEGNLGYSCRTRGRQWMFVPEIMQPDSNIYNNLPLSDLVFKNTYEKQYEVNREVQREHFSLVNILKSKFKPAYKPKTIGGLLFISY